MLCQFEENNISIVFFNSPIFLCVAAQGLGLPFLSPYLQSIGSNYRHGANYATLASTVLLPNTSLFVTGISPFSLAIQLNQMKEFKTKVDEFHRSSSSYHGTGKPWFHLYFHSLCSQIYICKLSLFFAPYDKNSPVFLNANDLKNVVVFRIDETSFTRHFRKISLHILHWSKWFHFQLSCYRNRWSETVSPSSGLPNCWHHQGKLLTYHANQQKWSSPIPFLLSYWLETKPIGIVLY